MVFGREAIPGSAQFGKWQKQRPSSRIPDGDEVGEFVLQSDPNKTIESGDEEEWGLAVEPSHSPANDF